MTECGAGKPLRENSMKSEVNYMKLKKTAALAVTACMTGTAVMGMTGCKKDEPLGVNPIGDRTEITFYCDGNELSDTAWKELITAYNDGAGLTDQVYVTADIEAGVSGANGNYFIQDTDYAYNVLAINDGQNSGFQTHAITRDGRYAPDGYLLNLQKYADKDEDFKKNTIPDRVLNWWRMKYDGAAASGSGKPKHIVGAGQDLMAVPYGTDPQFNWYNEALFKAQGINIISVPEEELEQYNKDNNSSVKPHGYAEYKTAPKEGMTSSKNLLGQTVYKVFNNNIGMNWEEMRNLLKYFTPAYNNGSKTGTKATSKYGFVSEYWFNYGWSVGGDVMGFNGVDYDFTLMDQRPNYIVTKDDTVINGVTYSAGEIVRYEDRVNGIENAATKPENIYEIESQYNAVKEYVSLQVNSGTVVDKQGEKTYYGYGVANPNVGSADNWFNNGEIAMTRGKSVAGILDRLESKHAKNFNICLAETYREYEGGSVYYTGEETFANEYLKVIGETYGNEVYTGDVKVVGDAKIIGNSSTASTSQALVIPACSDPEKYQAAWDFISWVATEGQQYIAKTKTLVPVAEDVLFSDKYADNAEINHGLNYYPLAKLSCNVSRGDWGYFESGQWVTNWANMFNSDVRQGRKTMSAFMEEKAGAAKTELNNMFCVIKGIR